MRQYDLQYIQSQMIRLLILACLLIQAIKAQSEPTLTISNIQIIQHPNDANIFSNGQLNSIFNHTIYRDDLNCRNGELLIINNTVSSQIVISYSGMLPLTADDILINVEPNLYPNASLNFVNESTFSIAFNCPQSCSNDNYYNQVTVNIKQQIQFSFLLNCDPEVRHKKFQLGYLIIAIINAGIIFGVAMHSHVWSIRINLSPLRYNLRWQPFLIVIVVSIVIILIMQILAIKDFQYAYFPVKLAGIIVSIFFVFLCSNESFYLIKDLRKQIWKFVRICDIISFFLTSGIITTAFFTQNWILYTFIAGCICVGSIKIFYFTSLRQSFLSMMILVFSTTGITIAFHFTLPRSYNDYAGQLSSPLFILVPDLVDNLYKKCSWLPVFDVIIPGVTLSYLRLFDRNRSSRWGGIYTVSCNLAFVISTIIWILLQFVYPFSVPFSLVTYSLLMLSIFLLAHKRNDWKPLFWGTFIQDLNIVNQEALDQDRQQTFSELDAGEAIDQILIRQKSDQSDSKQGSQIISS